MLLLSLADIEHTPAVTRAWPAAMSVAWRAVLLAALMPAAVPSALKLADLTPGMMQGHVLVLRHALAPGGSDPDGFNQNVCSTQRNLDSVGRAQST